MKYFLLLLFFALPLIAMDGEVEGKKVVGTGYLDSKPIQVVDNTQESYEKAFIGKTSSDTFNLRTNTLRYIQASNNLEKNFIVSLGCSAMTCIGIVGKNISCYQDELNYPAIRCLWPQTHDFIYYATLASIFVTAWCLRSVLFAKVAKDDARMRLDSYAISHDNFGQVWKLLSRNKKYQQEIKNFLENEKKI